MVVGKTGLIVFFYQKTIFLIYFLPKTPRKHHRQLDKHIHGLKKIKKPSQNPKPKFLPRLDQICFFFAISR
jgi:hypothetical protein